MFEILLIGMGLSYFYSVLMAVLSEEVPDELKKIVYERPCPCGKTVSFKLGENPQTITCECQRVHLVAYRNFNVWNKVINECSKCKTIIPICEGNGEYIYTDKGGCRFLVMKSNPRLIIKRLPANPKAQKARTLLIRLEKKFW